MHLLVGLAGYLGAALRWLFLRKKRTFDQLYNEPGETNERIGFLVFLVAFCSYLSIITDQHAKEERAAFVKRRVRNTIELATVESDYLVNIYDRSIDRLQKSIKDSAWVREKQDWEVEKHVKEMADLLNRIQKLDDSKEILKEDQDLWHHAISPLVANLNLKQLDSLGFKFSHRVVTDP